MAIRPRTSSHALILAVISGFTGFLVTVIAGWWVWPGHAIYARGLLTLGVLGAGVGWLVGATVGLVMADAAPPRTTAEAWILRTTAVFFVIAGLTTPWWTLVLPRTQGLGYHVTAREPMLRSIWFAAALAAVTCLVLAQRRFRREAIVIGAVAAIGILVSAIVMVASGPCPLSHCDELLSSGAFGDQRMTTSP